MYRSSVFWSSCSNFITEPFFSAFLTMEVSAELFFFGTYDGIDKITTVPLIFCARIAFSLSISSALIESRKTSVISTQLYSLINGIICTAAASSSRFISPPKL